MYGKRAILETGRSCYSCKKAVKVVKVRNARTNEGNNCGVREAVVTVLLVVLVEMVIGGGTVGRMVETGTGDRDRRRGRVTGTSGGEAIAR